MDLFNSVSSLAKEHRQQFAMNILFTIGRLYLAFTTFGFGWSYGKSLISWLPETLWGFSTETTKHILAGVFFMVILDGLSYAWEIYYRQYAETAEQRAYSKTMSWLNMAGSITATLTYTVANLLPSYLTPETISTLGVFGILVLLLAIGVNAVMIKRVYESTKEYIEREFVGDLMAQQDLVRRAQVQKTMGQALKLTPQIMANDVPVVANQMAQLWRDEILSGMGYIQDENTLARSILDQVDKLISDRLNTATTLPAESQVDYTEQTEDTPLHLNGHH